jgi:hypothetical protein
MARRLRDTLRLVEAATAYCSALLPPPLLLLLLLLVLLPPLLLLPPLVLLSYEGWVMLSPLMLHSGLLALLWMVAVASSTPSAQALPLLLLVAGPSGLDLPSGTP